MADTTWLPHLYLTWGGTFYGSEAWQMGVRFTPPATDTAAARDAFCAEHLADAASDISDWWQRAHTGASQHAILEWAKFNAIGTDGKYENKHVTHQSRYSPAVTPGTFTSVTTQHMPPQVALVLSLRTGNRGPREAWGHIYLPCAGIDYNFTGPYISDTNAGNVCGSFQEFISDLNNWPGLDGPGSPVVCIASKSADYIDRRSGVHKVFSPALTAVTEVWVGNLFDVHRSRAKQLRQTYSKQSV